MGVQLFGWKERIECERIQQKYIRWCLGLERYTPGYMILEETKRDQIRIRVGQRTMRYEERIRNATGINILKECLKEKKEEVAKTRNTEHSRETGISNEEWIPPSRYISAKRTEYKRGKNTKRKS